MAIHTIRIPDLLRGRELRSILWDDEAGAVEGEHSDVPDLRRFFEAPRPVTVGDPGGTWDLRDPGEELRVIDGSTGWFVLPRTGELVDPASLS